MQALGAAEPGPRRARQEGRRQAGRRGGDLARQGVRRAGHGAAGRRRRGDAPRRRRAGAAPRRAGHRAQPGDRHDAARGAACCWRSPTCQVGDVDEAVAAIEQVDVDDFPFGLAARALVRAVAGDTAVGAGRRRGGRGDARGELLRPRRSAGSPACSPASGPAMPAGSERLARAARARWRRRSATSCSSPSPRSSTTARRPAPTVPSRRRWPPAGAASSTPSSSAESTASLARVSLDSDGLAAGPPPQATLDRRRLPGQVGARTA